MCGRYQFKILPSNIGKQIKEKADELSLQYKQGEIFPNDYVLVIIKYKDKLTMKSLRWGILNDHFMINARLETINNNNNNYYKDMKNNRCVVIANGFYEWDKDKNKYYFQTNDEYIYLAAIYNDDNLLIITKDADESMNNIHDRMPIILNQDEMLKYILEDELIITYKELTISNINNEIKLF